MNDLFLMYFNTFIFYLIYCVIYSVMAKMNFQHH